jgi:hypothetical protein
VKAGLAERSSRGGSHGQVSSVSQIEVMRIDESAFDERTDIGRKLQTICGFAHAVIDKDS